MSAYIPYGAAWSSPFCKWQGSFAHLHAFELAARVTRQALERRRIDMALLETGVLGTTVPQRGAFYGLPWLAGRIGAPHLAGPTIAQACATGARVIVTAADEIERGAGAVLCMTTDRVSNGPHIYYPSPGAPGEPANPRTGSSTISPAIPWLAWPWSPRPRMSRGATASTGRCRTR